MKRSRKSITIQDVAREAGVSVSTVSRVLNQKEDVALDTSLRVKSVVAELGYASSLAARGMRSSRTNVIGLIMPDVGSPYCMEVMRGVNRAIARLDYDLVIYTNGDIRKYGTADQERHYVMRLNGGITDGVIVVAGATSHFSTNAPLVIVDPNHENPSFPAIISDNRNGARASMEYLIGLGHRRIGCITGRLDLISAVQRLQCYKDALAAAGIPLDESLVQIGDYTIETAVECARTLLSIQDRPTAIFAANDMTAMGVYQAAAEAGLGIPQDLSVTGFDNVRDSALLHPPLTTVDQYIPMMGEIAVDMVIKLINGEQLNSNVRYIQTRLVVRESCRSLS